MRMASQVTQMILRNQLSANHPEVDQLFSEPNTNPWESPRFSELLRSSYLFVLERVNPENGKSVIFSSVENGQEITPVFTSVNQIYPFIVQRKLIHYRRVKATDIFSSLHSASKINFNPESPFSRVLTQDELRSYLEGSLARQAAPSKGAFEAELLAVVESVEKSSSVAQADLFPSQEFPSTPEISAEFREVSPVVESPVVSAPVVVAPVAPIVNVPAARSRVVIKRPNVWNEALCPRVVAEFLTNFSKDHSTVASCFAGVISADQSKVLTIGLDFQGRSDYEVNDALSELAIGVDSVASQDMAIEISVLGESPDLQKWIDEKRLMKIC